MGRLDGKVAVITGAGSAWAGSSALLFAREGAAVPAADVNERGSAETVEQTAPPAARLPSDGCRLLG
jgi:3-oxoacyl-[acyl-carrier protein] reductase